MENINEAYLKALAKEVKELSPNEYDIFQQELFRLSGKELVTIDTIEKDKQKYYKN